MNKKIIGEAYTFDDLLLVPAYSEVLPNNVSLKTNLTKNIVLNTPIVSAAMDTVTEARLAIVMAREGGIGFIHKNMTPQQQADEIRLVKRSEHALITDPIVLHQNATLKDAFDVMKENNISGLPIINKKEILVGILTNRDLKYQNDLSVLISEVMTKKSLITAPKGTTIQQAKEILLKHKVEKLPLVDDDFKVVGLYTFKDIDNLIEHPNAAKDSNGRLLVGAAVGIDADVLNRVEILLKAGADIIAVDSAHGHSKGVIETVKAIKNKFPNCPIAAGNIVTQQSAVDLINAGADCLKIGIGPGSICTTRIVAGVGVPQLSAIMEIYEIAKEKGVCIIADGGIKYSGDIVKALAAGANCVMIGSLLAGTDEAPGEEFNINGRIYKDYVGMGSMAAMKRGSSDRYFQSNNKKLVPEGVESKVPYKGKLKDNLFQLFGGIRAGMGYCGAADLAILRETSRFVKITQAGLKESHPHNIFYTKESPNYYE